MPSCLLIFAELDPFELHCSDFECAGYRSHGSSGTSLHSQYSICKAPTD